MLAEAKHQEKWKIKQAGVSLIRLGYIALNLEGRKKKPNNTGVLAKLDSNIC